MALRLLDRKGRRRGPGSDEPSQNLKRAAAASADKWVLCLSGNSATVSVDWVSVLVVDVGSLGTNEVNKAVDQKLRLESTVSLVTDDLVWFNSGDVCTSGGATDSNQQKFTGSATYDFDFSKATTSLTAAYKMCVSRSGATMQYSSSSVLVVPQATLGGPFMTGPRAIDVSPLSSFLGSAEVAFFRRLTRVPVASSSALQAPVSRWPMLVLTVCASRVLPVLSWTSPA